ncbi:glycosyltransferase family 9 protein [Brevibacterium sp.]|uniref:glycosyltransferase family 9 protein n=1 Tax=Brevibacterium sp. TaxID=1701 RepID=UPI0025BFA3AF|nr:glycosyltransferase family 9 protein [Brevibacterium sp.]
MAQPTVLALRALKLGDLLVAVPALRALRRGFPDHRLVLACPAWLAPVVELIGGVDAHLPVAGLEEPLLPAAGSVEGAVNLHGGGPESRGRLEELGSPRRIGHRAPGWDGPVWTEALHERERWVRLLAWHGIPGDPAELRLRAEALDTGARGGGAGCAVVHVGASHGSRQWPVERFAEVVRGLAQDGLRVRVTGDDRERARAEAVVRLAGGGDDGGAVRSLAGVLSLRELCALIAGCSLVVSADTGAAHLASAFARPSVVLFGPAAPERWGPPAGPHRVLTDARLRRGEVFAADPDPALLAVGAAEVLREARALLR